MVVVDDAVSIAAVVVCTSGSRSPRLRFAARCRHYLRSVAIRRAEACRRHDLLATRRVDTTRIARVDTVGTSCTRRRRETADPWK